MPHAALAASEPALLPASIQLRIACGVWHGLLKWGGMAGEILDNQGRGDARLDTGPRSTPKVANLVSSRWPSA